MALLEGTFWKTGPVVALNEWKSLIRFGVGRKVGKKTPLRTAQEEDKRNYP